MTIAIDVGTLPGPAQKILDAQSPAPLRQMAAKGIAPGLKPGDALTVVVLLSQSADEAVRTAATATLDKLPAPLLNGALATALPAGVLEVLAPRYLKDAGVMEKILAQGTIAMDTVAAIAEKCSEAVGELVATNEERLLKHPPIIEKLYMNPSTRMSTADRVLELAVRNKLELTGIPAYEEAAEAIQNELIAEPSPEPTPDDIHYRETEKLAETIVLAEGEDTHKVDEATGEEKVEEKVLPLHAQLAAMTISQRIRRAMLGSGAERNILIRDSNKLVAQAAVKSPMIQEADILRVSQMRNVSEGVLTTIARSKKWLQNHELKVNLVMNPRLPFLFASKFISHLRNDELKDISKSKNVSGNVAQACKQTLQRRSKPEK